MSVQVVFTCDHGTPLKVICNGCSLVTLKKKLAKLGGDPRDTRPLEAKLAETDHLSEMIQILEAKLSKTA